MVHIHTPDIIFMDIQLPHQNGLFLTEKIKSRYPQTPIIIITGFDNPDYREAATKSGADLFLSKKDLKTRDIVNAVESLL
jgi:two-component system response regulator YesN